MRDERAVVGRNVTNLRAQADQGAEVVSQALFGETVRVLQHAGEWAEVETPDAYRGWALEAHLVALAEGERYPEPERAAMVAPLFLPVFRAPSARAERLTLLTLGTTVEIGGAEAIGPYYPVRMPDGLVGYAEGGALIVPQFPPPEHLGPNLAVVARGLIGVPYLWGGRSPFGIDCSGFTQRVYALCGQSLPRDAYLQAAWEGFREVERRDLEAGDLVFFRGERDPRNRGITHVGMALGDGRFIHASQRLGVAITALDAAPYDRQYRGARRFDPARAPGAPPS